MAVADLADLVDLDPRDQVAVVRGLRPADDGVDALEGALVAGRDDLGMERGGRGLGVAGTQRGQQALTVSAPLTLRQVELDLVGDRVARLISERYVSLADPPSLRAGTGERRFRDRPEIRGEARDVCPRSTRASASPSSARPW